MLLIVLEIFACLDQKNEENSGVEFPGQSLEPYVGSSITLTDHDFSSEVVLVEVKREKFAYKYEHRDRVQIGQCEFCNQRKLLEV